MILLRRLCLLASTTVAFSAVAAPKALAADAPTPVRVLLVTGEDYKGHKWELTAPVLKTQLEKDARLSVDVLDDLTKLRPAALQGYAAAVMHFKNYNPETPGRAGFDALENFVQRGGGLVLVHFACGAFQEFKDDFAKLAGRAWNPKLRGHDPRGEFLVEMADVDHPITRGMEPFTLTDELYTCLDGDAPITVLADAKSKVDGKRYPMAFVLPYGKGRVYHNVLGHDTTALGNDGCGELFRRGTAWAAGLAPTNDTADATAAKSPWTFVSMPDFLNVDTTYPEPGWEDALSYILQSVKAEEPEFLLVAGDQLMGRWWSEDDIEKYAAIYYPAWIDRMKAHGLKFYTAIGDHEIGDNPWPPVRAKLVPSFKAKFRDYFQMPDNGPAHMKGTAFWWRHRGVLFVAVDVFEEGDGPQGKIAARVTGEQLAWLEKVLEDNADADHIVVMGHTPILGPVRAWSSSRLMLEGGRESPLWQTMKRHGVDLYLCGEVHAITCIEHDGVWQIAHGGLIGYNTRTNYLRVRVTPAQLDLELKEIDMFPSGERLWQVGQNRPLEKVTITEEARRRGFVPVGRLTIDKSGGRVAFGRPQGYFEKKYEPAKPQRYGPVFRSGPAAGPPRVTLED